MCGGWRRIRFRGNWKRRERSGSEGNYNLGFKKYRHESLQCEPAVARFRYFKTSFAFQSTVSRPGLSDRCTDTVSGYKLAARNSRRLRKLTIDSRMPSQTTAYTYGEVRLLQLDNHLRRQPGRQRTILQQKMPRTRGAARGLT